MNTSDSMKPSPWRHCVLISYSTSVRLFLKEFDVFMNEDSACLIRCSGSLCVDLDDLLRKIKLFNEKRVLHPDALSTVDAADVLKDSSVVYCSEECDTTVEVSPLDEMRRRAEERRYKRSVANVASCVQCAQQCPKDTFMKDSLSLGTGINLITGIFLTFIGSYYFLTLMELEKPMSLILGVILSFMFLLVEVALIMLYDRALQKKQQRQLKAKQKFVVPVESKPQSSTEVMSKQPLDSYDTLRRRHVLHDETELN